MFSFAYPEILKICSTYLLDSHANVVASIYSPYCYPENSKSAYFPNNGSSEKISEAMMKFKEEIRRPLQRFQGRFYLSQKPPVSRE